MTGCLQRIEEQRQRQAVTQIESQRNGDEALPVKGMCQLDQVSQVKPEEDSDLELRDAMQRAALERRKPAPGLVHHPDRGVHYASRDYTALLTEHGVRISMSRRGNPYSASVGPIHAKTETPGVVSDGEEAQLHVGFGVRMCDADSDSGKSGKVRGPREAKSA